MKRLVSVIRRPGCLVGLLSVPGTREESPREGVRVPLAEVHESLCPWGQKDVAAWRGLAAAPNLSRRAGLAIVRTLIGSVSDPEYDGGEPPAMDFSSGAMDLQPHLCDAAQEEVLVGALGTLLDDVSEELDFPDWHWHRRFEIAALPPMFRTWFLWSLHLSPWEMVEEAVVRFDELSLEDRPGLGRSVATLLSHASKELALRWISYVARLPTDEQLASVEWVIESRAYERPPEDMLKRAV